MNVPLRFGLDRLRGEAPQQQHWWRDPLFGPRSRGGSSAVIAGGQKAILKILRPSHAGMTSEEFAAIVADWIGTARHPSTGHLKTQLVDQPMLELLQYQLRAHGFRTFIVSSGGVEIHAEIQRADLGHLPRADRGQHHLARSRAAAGRARAGVLLPEVGFIDGKEGKPIGIQTFLGRCPLAAMGNSDSDHLMPLWAISAPGSRVGLLLHHTEGARAWEWAYDRCLSIGRLDKGLEMAWERGWTVVDMMRDCRPIHL